MTQKFLLTFALLFLSSNVYSYDRYSVYLLGYSYHLESDGLNEEHDLIGLEYNNIFIGAFNNSYDDLTFLTAYNFSFQYGYFSYGALLGVSVGYDCEDIRGLTPCYEQISGAIMPYIEYNRYFLKPILAMSGEAIILTTRFTF